VRVYILTFTAGWAPHSSSSTWGGCFTASLIADLGSKEVLENAEVVNLEFDDKGLFLVQAETGKARNSGGLVEHVEVSEGKLLSDRLSDLEEGLLLLLVTVVVSKLDWTWADLTLNGEDNILRVSGDLDGLTQGEELLADLWVLVRVDGHNWLILGLGDSEVLAIDSNEIQVELSCALILFVLEDDLEMSGFLVSL